MIRIELQLRHKPDVTIEKLQTASHSEQLTSAVARSEIQVLARRTGLSRHKTASRVGVSWVTVKGAPVAGGHPKQGQLGRGGLTRHESFSRFRMG